MIGNKRPSYCSSLPHSIVSDATSPSSTTRCFSTSSSMSDEVKKAIAAAESADATSGEPTIFAKIVKGEIPCTKVFENDTVLAFRDVNPQAPVHILVIPKTPIDGISTAVGSQTNLLGELMLVAGQIGKTECPNGFRLVINDGKEGAQSVYHLHVHVLGGRQMQWPPG